MPFVYTETPSPSVERYTLGEHPHPHFYCLETRDGDAGYTASPVGYGASPRGDGVSPYGYAYPRLILG
jgi:hypothetical protein